MTDELKLNKDTTLTIQYPGQDGCEEIILAAGTEHEIKVSYGKPAHLNEGISRILRALIEEIESLKRLQATWSEKK